MPQLNPPLVSEPRGPEPHAMLLHTSLSRTQVILGPALSRLQISPALMLETEAQLLSSGVPLCVINQGPPNQAKAVPHSVLAGFPHGRDPGTPTLPQGFKVPEAHLAPIRSPRTESDRITSLNSPRLHLPSAECQAGTPVGKWAACSTQAGTCWAAPLDWQEALVPKAQGSSLISPSTVALMSC